MDMKIAKCIRVSPACANPFGFVLIRVNSCLVFLSSGFIPCLSVVAACQGIRGKILSFSCISWFSLFLLCCCHPTPAHAQLSLLPPSEPQLVFAGQAQTIHVAWRNPTNQTVSLDIRT